MAIVTGSPRASAVELCIPKLRKENYFPVSGAAPKGLRSR
ncbi:hypothetical protein ACVWXM_009696 [Bradyrhizobium sp. GM7.3]